MVARALRLRCPKCGTKWPFVHWLKPAPKCASCDQALERVEVGEGHYLGAMVVNFAAMESLLVLLVLAAVLVTWPAPPWNLIIYGGIALAVIAPLAFFPIAKLLWLAIDLYIQPKL